MINFEKCINLLQKVAQTNQKSVTVYLDGTAKNLSDVDEELMLIESNPEYAHTVSHIVDEWGDKIDFTAAKTGAIIKKTRTITEEYEVCPHCGKEIGEKETFIDKDNNIFHRPCCEKGPIDKLTPIDPKEFEKQLQEFWQSNAHNGKLNFAKIKALQNS